MPFVYKIILVMIVIPHFGGTVSSFDLYLRFQDAKLWIKFCFIFLKLSAVIAFPHRTSICRIMSNLVNFLIILKNFLLLSKSTMWQISPLLKVQ